MYEEVDYIDGVQEFIESEYITELLEKGSNRFVLRGNPSIDSIKFSGDVSLFKKQVYSEKDLTIPSSWLLVVENDIAIVKINNNSLIYILVARKKILSFMFLYLKIALHSL